MDNENDKKKICRGWYVLHVFSGYEQKIEKQINLLIREDARFSMHCHAVKVPMYEQTEMKDGKPKVTRHKLMPGYILVDLDLPPKDPKNRDDFEIHKQIVGTLKSINGVTGFVGLTTDRSSQPKPLSQSEFNRILEQTGERKVERTIHTTHDYAPGDSIKITTGSFSGFNGTVSEILHGKLKVSVEIFGRPTLIEVDVMDTEKK